RFDRTPSVSTGRFRRTRGRPAHPDGGVASDALELPAEQDARLAGAVVVAHLRLDLEAEPAVEGDRPLVARRGHAADDVAAGSAHGGEEPLIELAAEAGGALLGPDADEVDVRLVGIGLREEATEEA